MKIKSVTHFAKTILAILVVFVLFLSCKKEAEAESQQTFSESQAVAVAAAQEPKDETEQKKTESEVLSLPERMTTDYSKVNFDEYQKKDYEYDGTGYYEKYYVYYKSYFYDDEETGETFECVKEYYFVGEKDGKEEIILCGKFENIEKTLFAYIYNSEGKQVIYAGIGAYLYYEDKENYNGRSAIVYGFSTDNLSSINYRGFIFRYIQEENNGIQEGSFWRITYDFQNNKVSQFDPTM
ncbi:MAG: hypothetical protein J6U06_03885 [Spirochaetaceae bacterium]|nr:hypothetical protein [Spirochaetaceae bacterium]